MTHSAGTFRWLIVLLIPLYGLLFLIQESNHRPYVFGLSEPLPARLQQTALGYLHQLGAEMLYIKVAVFLGGRNQNIKPEIYAPTLSRNFRIMATLHPGFQDIYYLCESSLAWISPAFARQANSVLIKGIKARPDLWVIPFFKGFNHFHYLEEPAKAAISLRHASTVAGAPTWVGHLATILAARGGDIYVGYIWLKAMLTEESNETIRSRYLADIAVFEKALLVQKAIRRYHEKYGRSPGNLEALQPEFIAKLPQFTGDYVLSYQTPRLSLYRRHAR